MRATRENGFSLISVLMGLVLGLFVVTGAAGIYIDSERNARFHEALAAMHDNARYALQDLHDTVILTGRKVSPQFSAFGSFRAADRSGILPPVVRNADGASDTLVVSYAAGKECGLHRDVDDGIDSNEDVVAFEFLVNRQDQLVCQAHGYAATAPDFMRVLVDGVINMQVLYGVDLDGNGVADRYANATSLDADTTWERVITVRIGLLVSSGAFEVYAGDGGSDIRTYDVLDRQVNIPANDHRLFRVYTTTVALRNMMGLSRQAGL